MSGHPSQAVPELRVRRCNEKPANQRGAYVLYWMIAARRPGWNFALDRAVELAVEHGKGLVVLEALRVAYPFASARLHRFVLEGMRDNQRAFDGGPVRYHPYVEAEPGAGSGLLEALAERACAVVTDDYPCFFLPRMVAAAARRLAVRLEAVDSNGLLPLRAAERVFPTAHGLRSFLQRELPPHLEHPPCEHPLRGRRLARPPALPQEVLRRWPAASAKLLAGDPAALRALPIDHEVTPVEMPGGARAGKERMRRFLDERLARYDEDRNQPGLDGASGLSPYLHFGHVSAHQVLAALAEREGWSPGELEGPLGGRRAGWWGMSASAEAFLDQLVTWRELGFNRCAQSDDYMQYRSLPDWARATLAQHEADTRSFIYTRKQFERAETHDGLWNAAQRQLSREGHIHNYLRMLWGKKILEWSPSPRTALANLLHLNDRWALDGRDPNSYSGIFWILGRYDRAWGPERPIYGKLRYMSSANTARKLRLGDYLERFGP